MLKRHFSWAVDPKSNFWKDSRERSASCKMDTDTTTPCSFCRNYSTTMTTTTTEGRATTAAGETPSRPCTSCPSCVRLYEGLTCGQEGDVKSSKVVITQNNPSNLSTNSGKIWLCLCINTVNPLIGKPKPPKHTLIEWIFGKDLSTNCNSSKLTVKFKLLTVFGFIVRL